MGVYGKQPDRSVTGPERPKYQISAVERARRERWRAVGRAKVISPRYGTVVVPSGSNFSAILNAAEIWDCSWLELLDAEVQAAGPDDRPARMPYII